MNFALDFKRHIATNDGKLVADILAYLKGKAKFKRVQFFSREVYFGKTQVTMTMLIGNEEIEGTGCADTKSQAALKSVMELLERYIFLTQKVDQYRRIESHSPPNKLADIYTESSDDFLNIIHSTTNGMAANTNYFDAVGSATDEAIERHVLLKSMALNIKPRLINTESICAQTEPTFVKTYVWKGPLNKNIVAIKASFGSASCYGFGCSDELDNAIEKAKCEIAPRMNILRMKQTYANFKFRENEHFDFHLQKLSPWASNFFDCEVIEKVPDVDTHLTLNDFWYGKYNLPEDCSIKGIVVVRVVSSKLQPLFNGEWSIEKMNINAFDKTSFLKLPNELHMIG